VTRSSTQKTEVSTAFWFRINKKAWNRQTYGRHATLCNLYSEGHIKMLVRWSMLTQNIADDVTNSL